MVLGGIMTSHFTTVSPQTTLQKAWAVLRDSGCEQLIVVDKGKTVGVVHERDLIRMLVPFFRSLWKYPQSAVKLKGRVRDIMTKKFPTARTDTSVEEAAALLAGDAASCLPVLSGDGRLEGIVTWDDVLKAAFLSSASV